METLVSEVDAEDMRSEIAELWRRALHKYRLDVEDLPDVVAWHLSREDREHNDRVVASLTLLATG